jgi:hypothetical protein
MNKVFDEGNLRFDFTACDTAERFDNGNTNPYGMKSVDFFAETADCLYFIEVKDFQNPNAPKEQRAKDDKMLKAVGTEKKSVFNLEMGGKIKDSLLRRYAENKKFTKKVIYLLLINLDKLGEFERGLLKTKISGYIPTGLNDNTRFTAFRNISFDVVNAKQLSQHGIICTEILVES